ncbi:MAG: putative nucleotidyltransferase with HDIG domain [Candidatus Latescibacterota bacterium]
MADNLEKLQMSGKNILVVDQERLGGLIIKMLQKDQVGSELVTDGLKAITKLRSFVPDLIVADVNIPGGGLRLAELVGMNPRLQNVPVILMSANPTPDIVIKARNAGCSSYLAKPFRPSELTHRIESALSAPPLVPPAPPKVENASNLDPDAPTTTEAKTDTPESNDEDAGDGPDIINRVKSIEGLPSFPSTHAEILKLAKSDDATSAEIADKLQLDPGLLATMFKVVNSSSYGFNKQVKDLSLAVTLLGLEEIANIVLAAQIFDKLGNYEDGAGLDLKEFWNHSIGTAFVARAVARKLNTEEDSAFLAGMMHDLGKIILDRYFGDFYKAVFEVVGAEDIAIVQAEREILGVTHAAVGGVLAEEWKFPKNYLNAIAHHHDVRNAPRYQRLVCIVHLADIICRQLKFGNGGDDQIPEPDEAALDRFSLGDRGMKILVEVAEVELEGAASFLAALAR